MLKSVIPQSPEVKNIIFEAGGPWESESIIENLRKLSLTPQEIDLVVCSHGHSDHVGCLSLFPQGHGFLR